MQRELLRLAGAAIRWHADDMNRALFQESTLVL